MINRHFKMKTRQKNTQLLGVSYSLARFKIIRTMVRDWYRMMYFGDCPEKALELRNFVKGNFCGILEQAKKESSWRDFYRKYRY